MSTELQTTVELTKAELEMIREGLRMFRKQHRIWSAVRPGSMEAINRALTLDDKLGDAVNLCK